MFMAALKSPEKVRMAQEKGMLLLAFIVNINYRLHYECASKITYFISVFLAGSALMNS